MVLSLWSVLSALIWGSFFVFLLSSLRRAVPVIKRSGPFPLLIIAVLTVLRALLPADLPWFTNIISVPGSFTALMDRLRTPLWNTALSPLSVLLMLWLLSALLFLAKKLTEFLRFNQRVSRLLPDEEGEALEIAKKAAALLQMPAPLVIRSSRFDVPQVCGLFRPMILLPTYSYSDEEYLFIFLHELQHRKAFDLWIKLFSELFCCVFWWNPAMKLWKTELDQALEMRCDRAVARRINANREQIRTYIHTLNNTYLYSVIRAADPSWNYAVASLCASERMLLEREAAILEYSSVTKSALFSAPAILLSLLLFVFSYAFEVQPYHQPDAFDLKLDNAAIGSEEIDRFLLLDSAVPNANVKDFLPQSFVPLSKDGTVYGRIGSLSGAYLLSGKKEYTLFIDGQRIISVDPEAARLFAQSGFLILGEHEAFDPKPQYPIKEFSNGMTLWSTEYRRMHHMSGDLLELKFRLRHAGNLEYRCWNTTKGCWENDNWTDISLYPVS